MKKNRFTLILLAALMLVLVGTSVYAQFNPTEATPQQSVAELKKQAFFKPRAERIYTPEELLAEANRLRAEKGVAPLVIDERLNQSAQWKADDMKEFEYFGHVKPGDNDLMGVQMAYDTTNVDGKDTCAYISENLQWGGGINPFDWWVTSEKHYGAIINARYDTTGFGYVNVNGIQTYVQHFCDIK